MDDFQYMYGSNGHVINVTGFVKPTLEAQELESYSCTIQEYNVFQQVCFHRLPYTLSNHKDTQRAK